MEGKRSKAAAEAARREELLTACADFSASVVLVRSYSYRLDTDQDVSAKLEEALDHARVACERLRLLVRAPNVQKAARLALRHAYAVWKEAADGVDPRSIEYPGVGPNARLRNALTELYVGVRRETGMPAPEDVFVELD